MMRKVVISTTASVALLGLSACATDIMRGYVGREPEAVMARYGPPDNVFDMQDGRRAYQWVEISEATSAGSEETRTRLKRRGRHGAMERVTTTQINPASSQTKRCFYTMYAHRDAGRWIFQDFERPEFGCQ